MDEPLLTSAEVAAYLNVPITTLYEWRTRRTGPRGIAIGRHTRYRRQDLESWLESRKAAAGGPGDG